MKSQVFKIAHQIKSFCSNWSDALRKAWFIVKTQINEACFEFAKKDGEVRQATGKTFKASETAKKGYVRFIERLQDGSTQFRSFRIERLILS